MTGFDYTALTVIALCVMTGLSALWLWIDYGMMHWSWAELLFKGIFGFAAIAEVAVHICGGANGSGQQAVVGLVGGLLGAYSSLRTIANE